MIYEKWAFCFLAPPKRVSYLIISNENIFLKNRASRLGAKIAPNTGLEQTLVNEKHPQ